MRCEASFTENYCCYSMHQATAIIHMLSSGIRLQQHYGSYFRVSELAVGSWTQASVCRQSVHTNSLGTSHLDRYGVGRSHCCTLPRNTTIRFPRQQRTTPKMCIGLHDMLSTCREKSPTSIPELPGKCPGREGAATTWRGSIHKGWVQTMKRYPASNPPCTFMVI